MNKQLLIQVEELYKVYFSGNDCIEVLRGVDLKLYSGEILAIVGESGSGKSTLLNILGGLDKATRGTVNILGKNIHTIGEADLAIFRNQKMGYVFQQYHLLPDFTALENVMLPYLAYQYKKREAKERSIELLEDLGLKDRIESFPKELSGGEQQRVSIARALVNSPSLVLADEPTGNLDEKNSSEVASLFFKLRKRYGVSIVLVTHNRKMAKGSDRELELEHGKLHGS